MPLSVKLEVFEGPLDLLLHLIEKNKVDIYDIPIVIITEQYMEYIKAMDEKNPDVMSEFLLMAATLLDIKCRMLLPKEVNEEGEEEDPRAELVSRLLEYKIYKYMSCELRDMGLGAQKNIYKKPTIPMEVLNYREPVDYGILLGKVNLATLNRIFSETVKRCENKIDPIRSKFGNIEREAVDLEKKTVYIRNYLWDNKFVDFRQLLEAQNNKLEIIVTFLVILELIKMGHVSVLQQETFENIEITLDRDITKEEFFMAELDSAI